MIACSQTSAVGDIATTSTRGVLDKASSSSSDTMPAVGVLSWVSMGDAQLVSDGLLEGVYDNLIPGAVYYVGTDGRLADRAISHGVWEE